jgi:hypothetical protein
MSPSKQKHSADPAPYTIFQLGVWRVLRSKSFSGSRMPFCSYTPGLLLRFILEVFTIAPGLFILFILLSVWTSAKSTLSQHFLLSLLQAVGWSLGNSPSSIDSISKFKIEAVIAKETSGEHIILRAAASHLVFVVVAAVANWLR